MTNETDLPAAFPVAEVSALHQDANDSNVLSAEGSAESSGCWGYLDRTTKNLAAC